MSWKVGSYIGGTETAPPGNDYWIVIKSEAVAKSDASNGPFTLMAIIASPSASTPLLNTDKKELSAAPTALKPSAPPEVVKILSLTYPRRADGFHKGIQYKITWKSVNLNDARLKLELLDTQGTTVLQNIGENFDNTGEKRWEVPMTLPDERKLYKIRIQTMDGTKSDTVPIWIAKGAASAGSPTLKVTNPGMGDRAIGDTIPIKWTSTTTCSGNGGPLDDGFRIDLMNAQGNTKIQDLTDVGYVFDNEGPTGVLNWHWDWEIVRGSCNPGTYTIKVTSMNSPADCFGTSQPFRVLNPSERKTYTFIGKRTLCRYNIFSLEEHPEMSSGPLSSDDMAGISDYPLVGYKFLYHDNGEGIDHFIVRSVVTFSDDSYWYKKLGHLQEAKLMLERMWKTGYATTAAPALDGVALQAPEAKCCCSTQISPGFTLPPFLSGTIPVNATSQVDVYEIDISQHYLALTNQGKPDYGIILYPRSDYSTTCNNNCIRRNAENYKVTLKVRFINDVK
jgi:hypothetical protein